MSSSQQFRHYFVLISHLSRSRSLVVSCVRLLISYPVNRQASLSWAQVAGQVTCEVISQATDQGMGRIIDQVIAQVSV